MSLELEKLTIQKNGDVVFIKGIDFEYVWHNKKPLYSCLKGKKKNSKKLEKLALTIWTLTN